MFLKSQQRNGRLEAAIGNKEVMATRASDSKAKVRPAHTRKLRNPWPRLKTCGSRSDQRGRAAAPPLVRFLFFFSINDKFAFRYDLTLKAMN
ncbi:jg4944 [Pararge aegeria aegeria]|uniref:Jg4944 protein n=1 Tax=Pararge aegeria aegeria TaxID=348720 RepID=A0A8S4SJZ0_9NEOP|nr:jg4944 [Pararge aegeria aegeria]